MIGDTRDAAVRPMRRLGKYELVGAVGRGGTGEVFEARHVGLGKRVAIKVVRAPVGVDGDATRRVLREGRAATAVHHPNVVEMLDVGVEDGVPYLVMELLEGEDLARRLQRAGPLPVEEIVELMVPVLSGMAAAHAAGVIHRDLKPSNIFLAARHRGVEPVVVDFGISRTMDPTHATASSQGFAGTVPYMAPEQVRGSCVVTAKSDQYALGVILYECATGGTPFWNDDRYELLHAIVTGHFVPPSELNPSVTGRFDAVVLRAMAREPEARFPDVTALGWALLSLASEETRSKWAGEFAPVEGDFVNGVAVRMPAPGRTFDRHGDRRAARVATAVSLAALAGTALVGAAARWLPPRTTMAPVPPVASGTAAHANAIHDADARSAAVSAPPPPSSALAETSIADSAVARRPVEAQSRAPRPPPSARARPLPPPAAAPMATIERGTANIPIVE
jgi:eukaryotic-like serine/threonine-protein kinase